MKACFVEDTESWPEAEPFALDVVEVAAGRGEYGWMYKPGIAEVTLLGAKQDDGGRLVVPIAFGSLDQALRAGKVLADAFAALRAIGDEPLPVECSHSKLRALRFGRERERSVVCELCNAVFRRETA